MRVGTDNIIFVIKIRTIVILTFLENNSSTRYHIGMYTGHTYT
jgi:hypothetical protein